MESKTEQVRRLVADGEYKKALRIAKDFHLGMSLAERELMRRGYECMEYPDFYKSIDVDVDRSVRLAIAAVKCL